MAQTENEVDLALVRALAELLTETNLTEIEYDRSGCRIRVSRQVNALPLAAESLVPVAAPAAAAAEAVTEEAAFLAHPGLLTSPMVGVVYTSPEPGAPTFVSVGTEVKVGDPVLLIEAMKVFNPIAAPRAGRVIRLFVVSGQPVEYGEPLLIIE